jgi:hypothetical protein
MIESGFSSPKNLTFKSNKNSQQNTKLFNTSLSAADQVAPKTFIAQKEESTNREEKTIVYHYDNPTL